MHATKRAQRDAFDGIPDPVLRQLLTRREEDEGGRVARARRLARVTTAKGSEYLVLVAVVEVRVRSGELRAFDRVALAFCGGSFARVVSIRPSDAAELGSALLDAGEASAELLEAYAAGEDA